MMRVFALCAAIIALTSWSAEPEPTPALTNAVAVDLPTVLKLAGVRELDVQIARQKVAEAKANQESALWQFFPSISPGVAYRRHEDLIQDVGGRVIDVSKESYAVGPTISAQVDLGDAIYKHLAARQLARAAESGLEAQRQFTAAESALAFFDLLKAGASIRVADESVRIANDYANQLDRAVDAGLAFKGDQLRAQVQLEKNRLALRQAAESREIATARLVQLLRLKPDVAIVARNEDLSPIVFIATNLSFGSALADAAANRAEFAQNRQLLAATRNLKDAAKTGPWIPSIGAQAFAGGFGGGNDEFYKSFGPSEDYAVTLSWRIGPNGLFDRGRVRSAEARFRAAELANEKLVDDINRQVAEAFAHWRSLADQIATSEQAVRAAEATFRLTRQRKEFGVGAALEDIIAEQDLTRARLEYVSTVADFNKSQFALLKATGRLQNGDLPPPKK